MYLLASEDAFNSQRGLKDLRRALPFLFFEKGRRRASESEDAFNSQRGLKDLRRALPFFVFCKRNT
jgi:hypothetical protein